MAKRELKSTTSPVVALNTTAISSDTTTNGVIIDTAGYESILFIIQSGTITDGTYTSLIQEGDDSGLSDAASVADADLTNTEASIAFAATDDNTSKSIAYVGDKRYVRLNIVSASTSSGGTLSAVAIKGDPLAT
tara:strand:+ start:7182 stop:7583 length:402 start_codon:yes stop_codon:yes gene_type:complete